MNRLTATAAVLGALLIAPPDALAQVPAGQSARRSVFSRVVFGGAYDDNLALARPFPQAGSLFARQGYYTRASGTLGFDRRTRRSVVSTNGFAWLRHYPTVDSALVDRYGAAARAAWTPARNSRLFVSGTANRENNYARGVPGETDTDALEADTGSAGSTDEDDSLTLVRVPGWRTVGAVGFTQRTGRRSGLSVRYGAARSEYYTGAVQVSQITAADYRQQLSAAFQANAGYRFQDFRGIDGRRRQVHTALTGLGVREDIDRRTVVTASAGVATVDDGRRRVVVTGTAVLGHAFTRSWRARAGYSRRAGFIEGLDEPQVYQAAAVRVDGRFGRKVGVYVDTRYTVSERGRYNDVFHTTVASAGTTYRFSTRLSGQAVYRHYEYQFPNDSFGRIGAPDAFGRNEVLVLMSLQTRTRLEAPQRP